MPSNADMDRERWLTSAWSHITRARLTTASPLIVEALVQYQALASFPRTRVRGRQLAGEIVTTTDARPLVLVNPALATAPEVVAVLDYLAVRMTTLAAHNYHALRMREPLPVPDSRTTTAPERRALSSAGYLERFDRINPGPQAFARITETAAALVAMLGEYPHAAANVDTTTATAQTARMLKAQCVGGALSAPGTDAPVASPHPAYIVRLSRQQADRGMPICPVCHASGHTRSLVLV